MHEKNLCNFHSLKTRAHAYIFVTLLVIVPLTTSAHFTLSHEMTMWEALHHFIAEHAPLILGVLAIIFITLWSNKRLFSKAKD